MKNKSFVDCFMLMGTALSVKGPVKSTGIDDGTPTMVTLTLDILDISAVDYQNMVSLSYSIHLRIKNKQNYYSELVT